MQYNQIIDSDDRLIYSILTEFLNKNKQKIRIEEIKEQFDLSSHKLIKISERIDQLAKKTETFDFIATNKEWCFKTTPIFSLQDVYTEMIKSSVSYKLLMEVLNSSFTSLEEFSQKNFMTKRTFYRKINGLTDYLNNYHL
ncbi:helix-turn-helix domain-containing protein, partial [Enterococcus faecium]|nr:helix-turn-helix domain-containing protein [Enterococcus faecium]